MRAGIAQPRASDFYDSYFAGEEPSFISGLFGIATRTPSVTLPTARTSFNLRMSWSVASCPLLTRSIPVLVRTSCCRIIPGNKSLMAQVRFIMNASASTSVRQSVICEPTPGYRARTSSTASSFETPLCRQLSKKRVWFAPFAYSMGRAKSDNYSSDG
ncbi:MAG: hypothetical protein JWO91_1340 [Acidobacteriaceae bacterium]|nr:hypothetical protein [Acidobacteriaceae bacterium]